MTQIATIAKMQRKRCAVMIFDDFLIRAAIAAVGVAIAAAPLGCFVVWRRMAYVGDATVYAAILGVALALSVPVIWGILLIAIGMAFTVSALGERAQPRTVCSVFWPILLWRLGWWQRACSVREN